MTAEGNAALVLFRDNREGEKDGATSRMKMRSFENCWMAIVMALTLTGCFTVESSKYVHTVYAELPLKNNARVKIVSADEETRALASVVEKAFVGDNENGFKVVQNDADYWIVLAGASKYAKNEPHEKKIVTSNETQYGGAQSVTSVRLNNFSAAKAISVVVYETRPLAPIRYYDVPVFWGELTDKEISNAAACEAAIATEIGKVLGQVFLTKKRLVKIEVPLAADERLRRCFATCSEMYAKGSDDAFDDFLHSFDLTGMEGLFDALRAGTYEGDDALLRLSNYHLYLLAKCAVTNDSDELAKIRGEELKILEVSDARGIVQSVPPALGMIEYKLSHLGR